MPTINELNAIDQPSGSDLIPIFSQQNGDSRKISFSNFAKWLASQSSAPGALVTQYAAPSATGFTATITDNSNSAWLILTPTAGFAAGTIKLPSKANAADRQEVLVNCTQTVTTLTIDGNGATVKGAPTTLVANAFFRLRYDAVLATWYSIG